VYRDKRVPLPVRMKAARECLPFESPKLAVTGYVTDEHSFAQALERALMRSNAAMKVIEHREVEDAGE
jgi:hypothetical protein